jgi:glycosyltransferase involved in cell wall biosynthesis
MNLLFAHDSRFYLDSQGQLYSTSQWRYPVWERYLAAFDTVTVAARRGELPDPLEGSGLEVSGGPGVSFAAIPSLSDPIAMWTHHSRAVNLFEEALRRADALIARLPSDIGALACRVAEKLQKPWAVEVVGCAWDAIWNHGSWQGKVYAPYALWRMRGSVRRAPYALYVTQEFLQQRYPSRGRTAACSNVEIPEPDDAVLAGRLTSIHRQRSPIRIGLIDLLSVRYKGVDTALAALHSARHDLPPFELRILGRGCAPMWQGLVSRLSLSQQVLFCGVLPGGAAVRQWLDEIDLYIQPSRQEGLPRAVIEAMSRGCPALGSTAGGIPELLDPECLHRPSDHRRLAELLVQATTDKQWQVSQARRNFEAARRYAKPVLDQLRSSFWREFAEAARTPAYLPGALRRSHGSS